MNDLELFVGIYHWTKLGETFIRVKDLGDMDLTKKLLAKAAKLTEGLPRSNTNRIYLQGRHYNYEDIEPFLDKKTICIESVKKEPNVIEIHVGVPHYFGGGHIAFHSRHKIDIAQILHIEFNHE